MKKTPLIGSSFFSTLTKSVTPVDPGRKADGTRDRNGCSSKSGCNGRNACNARAACS